MNIKSNFETLPREKLITQGIAFLSDSEVLSLLLGNGSTKQSVLELSKVILQKSNGIYELGRLTLNELVQIHGVGYAKAMIIIGAMELGRRRVQAEIPSKAQIRQSRDGYQEFQFLSDCPHEEFWILLLNRNNRICSKAKISTGGVSGTVVDVRLILKRAIDHLASAIVLCHNHPSGNARPSEADIKLTRKIKEAARLHDIDVVDHIIIAEREYFSFADDGLI
jgi:DNA repair protein RadC